MTNFEQLSLQELSTLRAHLIPRARDARKKALAAIMSEAGLKEHWNRYMTPVKDSTVEERQISREAFESVLARFPDAYLKQISANYLVEVEASIQTEMLRRSSLRAKK